MTLTPFCQTLLEETRSETKRLGGELSIVHLASVLRRRYPADTEDLLPDGDLKPLLGHPSLGGETEVIELLEGTGHEIGPRSAESLVSEVQKRFAAMPALAHAPDEEPADSAQAEVTPPATPEWVSSIGEVLEPADVVGREELVDAIIERIGRQRSPVTPLLVGRAGSGRTALLSALAARLADSAYAGPLAGATVFRIKAHSLVDRGGAGALRNLANELGPDAVLCLDDLEVAAGFSRHGADMDLLRAVRSLMAEQAPRIVLCIDSHHASQLAAFANELDDELEHLPVPQLDASTVAEIVDRAADDLEHAHEVALPREVRELAAGPARTGNDIAHPGLAMARLDRACVRARLAGRHEVTVGDLGDSVERADGPVIADDLARRLLTRVRGQDRAVTQIAERLALTRAELDLRPDRPDGVFLIVGPTGVGKTELAKSLADELFGSQDSLIRLDMSEYAHEWALSMITGPPPGYVGSTDPAGWLTTKVLGRPNSVVLLDEFEKSHPRIWNTFLQVFDDGRLTDSMGRTVDFSRTVFILTSNLGARDAAKSPMGFGSASGAEERFEDRMREAAKQTLAPELINRLDDIVVFRSLDPAAIAEITRQSIDRILERYRTRGFELDVPVDVVEHLALSGYSPEYGARHVHRNIEQLLLAPLVGVHGSNLRATLVEGTISWEVTAS